MKIILIGGDVCPQGLDTAVFERGDALGIFHDLLEEFLSADLSIVNLECPLTDVDAPILKTGPALRAPSACISGLKKAGIHVLNLANNHILDHGAQGVENTLRIAKSADVATVGAGLNLACARRILIRQAGDMRIGILGIAEHEFCIATESSYGASPIDLIDIVRNIDARRGDFDYLIVLLHGGKEHYPYPSPQLMQTCRFLIEQGANAVICQHSHCVGCYENYSDGHIVYGQGNLIFKWPNASPEFQEGILVKLCIDSGCKSQMELIPTQQSHMAAGVRTMSAEKAELLLQAIEYRSSRIRDHEFVNDQWQQFCKSSANSYMSHVLGHGFLLRFLNCHFDISQHIHTRKSLLCVQNVIRCETHREVLNTILKQRLQ
jgi:poly-gamma-glutamate synthesis protein (capsule biosynthesis protein)